MSTTTQEQAPATQRETFVAAMSRDTRGTELERLSAVLDAILAWSAKRPGLVTSRGAERSSDALHFTREGAKVALWSIRAPRGGAPTLEVSPATVRTLDADTRARACETLTTHSRAAQVEGDRMRIGLAALKNPAALTAVLALLEEVLAVAERAAAPQTAAASSASAKSATSAASSAARATPASDEARA